MADQEAPRQDGAELFARDGEKFEVWKMRQSSLGITYGESVGRATHSQPLMWHAGDLEPEFLDLSLEHEKQLVENLLDADIEDDKRRKKERWRLLKEAGRLLPNERVAQCSRGVIDKSQDVAVLRSKDSGHTFFSNVKRCDCIWCCAVCAPKITEKRRKDLENALAIARVLGLEVFMLTLTIPHHSGNDTRDLCDQLLASWQRMQNRTFWRNWRKEIGLKGTVRALEVTYGLNGAHVHIHILLFRKAEHEQPEAVRSAGLITAWKSACTSVGLPEPNEHGVDIRNGNHAASYVSKWGLDSELTKSHIKRGKTGRMTAWDLLRASINGDREAGRKFQEHANAFFNRRQLVWSKGLRDLLDLGREKSDQELGEEQTETADEVAKICTSDWMRVLRWGARATVLIIAENGGQRSLTIFLRALAEVDSGSYSQRRARDQQPSPPPPT